ncbi:unnamed protein product [Amoebophrya sp. A120]|nr:unnamed protein product [Amoebophrya sp. A120]|eukprot:GSA120T00005023001.1
MSSGEELFEYARRGKSAEVKELLAGGTKPDDFLAYDGSSALLMAAKSGHNDTVSLLLDHGADWSLQTDDLSTILHVAIRQPVVLQNLLTRSREVKTTETETGDSSTTCTPLIVDQVNEDGFSPLHLACYYADMESIKVLVETGGANVNLLCDEGSVLDMLPESCAPEVREYLTARFDEKLASREAAPEKITEKYGYGCFDGDKVEG